MLHASEITVSRGGKRIVDEVSVSIIGGEMVALVGPSGAGKSTLLRTLCGDLTPVGGEVWMAGRPVSAWSLAERAVRRAVLPQHASLTFPLTVFDVVLMGRAPHTVLAEGPQDRAIVEAALQWVEASHLKARLYPSLSGGEQQRVQLARVLAQVWGRPKNGDCYIFLDEPTTGLDLVHQHRTLSIAKQLAHDGAAVVMVLHDLNLAAQYCDRLLMMRAGQVVIEGRPGDVLNPSTIASVFRMDVTVMPHPTLPCPLVVPMACHRGDDAPTPL